MRLQVGDEESREQLIKDHYMARVGELTSQLQVSDSKAVHFHAEVSRGAPRLPVLFHAGGPSRPACTAAMAHGGPWVGENEPKSGEPIRGGCHPPPPPPCDFL